MYNAKLNSSKEVDTLRVSLLGFSLVSIFIFSFSVVYLFIRSGINYEGFLSDPSDFSLSLLRVLRVLLIIVFILPQIISLLIWWGMPIFIKRWYNLQALPSQYIYVSDLVQKIALEMDISPPEILYTPQKVANCFNLGRIERESAIVISKWVIDNLHSNELKAVCTHEIAHAKNKDLTLMAYLSATKLILILLPILLLVNLVYFPLHFGISPRVYLDFPIIFTGFIFLTFGCTIFVLGIHWFSRLREVAADARVALFMDKNILKRALYKLACAKSAKMLFVPSCLMMCKARGGLFSTHPPLYERYLNLDKRKYIIDPSSPLSFKFCFTTALGIFLFTEFMDYIISIFCYFIINRVPQGLGAVFSLVITVGLLLLYFHYLSIKYIGLIVFLITVMNFALILGLLLINFITWIIFPANIENFPPERLVIVDSIRTMDFAATTNFLLIQTAFIGILAFLIIVFLRKFKKHRPF
jgi:Zn-dependent protease with chaperone function